MKKPILLLDFDGVIHSYKSGWQGVRNIPDMPVGGALKFIAEATEHFRVCIYSARSGPLGGKRAMKKWLVKYGLDPWYIKDRILKFPKKKPSTFLTLDDRAICFTGVFPTLEEIVNFKPWQNIDWDGTGTE